MKERPILFSAPMVRAILEGRKTQTRREVKLTDLKRNPDNDPWYRNRVWSWRVKSGMWTDQTVEGLLAKCPYGQPRDRLWVRESARVQWVKSGLREAGIKYIADGAETVVPYPSRLAPAPVGKLLANGTYREASRILLENATIRPERLNDISEEDAKAEGIYEVWPGRWHWQDVGISTFTTARDAFKALWESINGPGSWEEKWVWVVEFKKVKP